MKLMGKFCIFDGSKSSNLLLIILSSDHYLVAIVNNQKLSNDRYKLLL